MTENQMTISRPIPPKRTANFYSIADAREYLKDFGEGVEVFGMSKGQFSLVDLIHAIIEKTGPCDVDVSTWTAAGYDASAMIGFVEGGAIETMRWLVDEVFTRRQPELSRVILEKGDMRVLRTHAKFVIFRGGEFDAALRTSMNLNANPRIEFFEITTDSAVVGFLTDYVDSVFIGPAGKKVKISDIPAGSDVDALALL